MIPPSPAIPKQPLLPFPSALVAAHASKNGMSVCIVGGGGSGAALAYDLSLRGFSVTLLEKGELTSGTTGRHHGQLHCGARYALGDRAIARECMEESLNLQRLVPQAIEYNGGLFIALDEEDAALLPEFVTACLEAGIPARKIPVLQALALEGALSPGILAAVWVPDGSFDAYRVPMSFFAAAKALGADIRVWNEVIGFEREGSRVTAARVVDGRPGRTREARIEADYFVNATGPWAARVGALAGFDFPVTPAPGSLVAVRGRLVDHVVSRLHRPGDGDIVVPQRMLTIIGTTQRVVDDPEALVPPPEDIPFLVGRAATMVPAFAEAVVHAAWSAARPLAGRGSGRSISRDFVALDHEKRDGVAGICTLIGGKATVLRAMAEKSADLVCEKLGAGSACHSAEFLLPSWRNYFDEGRG